MTQPVDWELEGWVPVESPGQWSALRAALSPTPARTACSVSSPQGVCSPGEGASVASWCKSAVPSPPPGRSASAGRPACWGCRSFGGPSCHRGSQPWRPPSQPVAACPKSAGVARGALLTSLGSEALPGSGGTHSSARRWGALRRHPGLALPRLRLRLSPVTRFSSLGAALQCPVSARLQ